MEIDKELLKELIDKQVKKQVQKALKEVFESVDVESTIIEAVDNAVETRVDKKLGEGENLEELMLRAMESNVMQWAEQNMYEGDIKQCIRSAMINRLSLLSLSELVGMVGKGWE